jgi:hypothetical protein
MTRCRLATAAAIAIAIVGGTAAAQQSQEPRIFTFHANASGSCPDLDWHVVLAPDDTVTGMIGWQNMQMLVRVTGKLDRAKKTFSLTGKEAGGNLTATIDGQVISPNHLVAHIKAPEANVAHIKAPEANVDCPKVEVWGMTPTQIKTQGAGKG